MRQIHSVKCYAVRKAIGTYYNIYDPGNTMLSKRSLSQKTMLYYFIYINCREEANPKTEIRLVISWGDPLEEEIATTQVFLPGKSHGWSSLVGYGPWGHKESDMTEWACERALVAHACMHTHTHIHRVYGRQKWGVTANRYGVSMGVMKCSKISSTIRWLHNSEYTKIIELCI